MFKCSLLDPRYLVMTMSSSRDICAERFKSVKNSNKCDKSPIAVRHRLGEKFPILRLCLVITQYAGRTRHISTSQRNGQESEG